MTKKVLVPIADGTEEIEAVCIIDVLRRAGADVTVASVGSLQVTASRGVKLVADKQVSDCTNEIYDLIALRAGYRQLFLDDVEGGFTFGFGLHFNFFMADMFLDYASVDYGRLEKQNKFSLIFSF